MKRFAKKLYHALNQNPVLYKLRQRVHSYKDSGHKDRGMFSLDIPAQDRSDSPVKYGLLRYTYMEREGYWCDEVNIGDYIQSLAARQFLPRVDTLVERDAVAGYQGDRVRVIMNGWWHIYKGNAVPSKQIEPLYVSIHLTNPQEVPPETIEHFKKHEPIGCRDHSTMNFLQSRGVDAYFSGCMTLTLGKTYTALPEERTNTIYYVNFDPNIFTNYVKSKLFMTVGFTSKKVRCRLNDILNTIPDYTKCRRIYRDHSAPLSLPAAERFRIADQYLQDYARAKLVITTKIHCALPCAGMGVPVILMMNNPQDARFGGIKELLNHLGVDTNGEIIQHLFLPPEMPGAPADAPALGNSPDIPTIVEALSQRCREFVDAPY